MSDQKFELAIRTQQLGLKLAARAGYSYLARLGMKRPEWIYRSDVTIPRLELSFASIQAPTPASMALCSRLIAAYQRACPEPVGNTGIAPLWSTIIDSHYQPLLEALHKNDAQGLALTLSTAFQQSFLHGISSASLYQDSMRARFWYLKCLDDLVSLAEYLGVVRTENPEQGTIGHALEEGADALVSAIEASIGIDLDFPAVGGAYGFKIGRSLITMETPEHTYAALRVNEALNRYLPTTTASAPNIVEIGAGFGGTAYRILKLRPAHIGSYTLIDLPLMNVCQGYFLGSVFGADKISLYGEDHSKQAAQPIIRVMPTVFINEMVEPDIDLLLNENSMPEMPEATVEAYIRWAQGVVRGIFYSYNHEVCNVIEGIAQVRVPAVVARVGGFRRLSRNLSWVRRGYVEEVYLNRPPDPHGECHGEYHLDGATETETDEHVVR